MATEEDGERKSPVCLPGLLTAWLWTGPLCFSELFLPPVLLWLCVFPVAWWLAGCLCTRCWPSWLTCAGERALWVVVFLADDLLLLLDAGDGLSWTVRLSILEDSPLAMCWGVCPRFGGLLPLSVPLEAAGGMWPLHGCPVLVAKLPLVGSIWDCSVGLYSTRGPVEEWVRGISSSLSLLSLSAVRRGAKSLLVTVGKPPKLTAEDDLELGKEELFKGVFSEC